MSSIQEWLKSIELEEYSERFLDARISTDLLPDLTEDDLEKLEIPLGDRKRILRAIASLAETPEDANEEAASEHRLKDPSEEIPEPVQLRQITVVFIDLVGSTELSERLDLETYKDLIRGYHVACTRVVTAHGGFVSQYAGDGVMAYFGYPRAQEDDPERAVVAGLAVVKEVSATPTGLPRSLAARVGIATGQVVIDGLVYEGVETVRSAMGEIPNLAARLQALAEPGQVLISSTTRRLLGNEFVCDDVGSQDIKGFKEKLQVFRVREIMRSVSRFEAHQRGSWTPFVNREEERNLLGRRWEQACGGKGNVVLLSGEPGIGKSRLARELAGEAGSEASMRLQFQCSAHHTQSALYPVVAHLEHAARINSDDPPDEKLQKITELLSNSPEDSKNLYHFARLLSVGDDEQEFAPGAANRRRREEMMKALIDRLLRLAVSNPLLVIFEDLHWIDPTSQELLDLFIERLAGKRILLVCTFRHEYSPPWTGLAHVTRLDVNRLSRQESATIVSQLTENKDDLVAAVDAIVAKTDGVPLFIEELTKAAIEAAAEPQGRSPLTDPLALPSTLKDSLMSRLDRLPLAEKVMPVGAAIGRRFSHQILAAVTGLDDTVLAPALRQLVDAELLFQRGEPPDATYTFKHALVQDVAYESVLKSRMRNLHARIAATIEERFPQIIESRPEVAARHLTRAHQHERALYYWEMAAEKAIARSANSEAVSHIEAALQELAHETDRAASDRKEIRLREMLCVPLEARSWGSDDIAENLNRLHDLVAGLGDSARLFTILHGLCGTHIISGNIELARKDALKLIEIAESNNDQTFIVLGHHALGMVSFFLGLFDEAIKCFERAIDRRANVADSALQKYYVADPEVVGRCMQAWARALINVDCVERSDKTLNRALKLTEAAQHDFTRAYGLSILASACQARGDAEATLDLARRARQLSRRDNFTYWEAWSQILLGWATAMTGKTDHGIARLRDGLEMYVKTGSRQIVPYANALLAEACLTSGRIRDGLVALEEIEEASAGQSVHFYDSRIMRLRERLEEADGGGTAVKP
ncbi:MAG: AAA family ATPase [Paracoccaceae bacterium]|nr:AAA family ATPase [Paracoccaceae bacterium]